MADHTDNRSPTPRASRRRRRVLNSTISSNTSQQAASSPYLTAAALRSSLAGMGVAVPASWQRKQLLQLYKENSPLRRAPTATVTSPSHDTIDDHEQTPTFRPSDSDVISPPQPTSSDNPTNVSRREFDDLRNMVQSIHASIDRLANAGQPLGTEQQFPSPPPPEYSTVISQPSQCQPASSNSLPYIDVVPPQLIRKIRKGEYVNLALLLEDNEIGDKVFDSNGDLLPSRHGSKLNRPLALQEFLEAFDIFRTCSCEFNPALKADMDKHQRVCLDLAKLYSGPAFYHYHVMFAKRVAAYLEKGLNITWGEKDLRIWSIVTSGLKAQVCHMCNSVTHTSAFCPHATQSSKPQATARHDVPSRKSPLDTRGRRRIVHEGREVCNNFNDRGCTRPHCQLAHVCLRCQGAHSQTSCTKSQRTK